MRGHENKIKLMFQILTIMNCSSKKTFFKAKNSGTIRYNTKRIIVHVWD